MTSPGRSPPPARARCPRAAGPRSAAAAARRSSPRAPPSRESGAATRSIGRELSESSPVSSKRRPSWPARRPGSSRASVPAFPQSIGASGSRSPESPRPRTRSTSGSSSSTETPSDRTAAIVDSVSSERPNPRTIVSPSHTAPTSSARCEIDLSPGTRSAPRRLAAGAMSISPRRDRRGRAALVAHSSSGHGVAST